MNSVSWLLYAAETADRASFFAALVLFFGGLGWLGLGIGYMAAKSMADEHEDARIFRDAARRPLSVIGVAWCLSLASYIFLPSRNTILLIAASEVSEAVLSSQQTQEIGGARVVHVYGEKWLED